MSRLWVMGTLARAVALSALVAGCVESSATLCGDGRVCPHGTICVDDLDLCATPEQLSVCQESNLRGGDPCTAGPLAGLCNEASVGEVCLPARCGDGYITAPEVCDGSALGAAPACNQHGYYEATEV